MSDSDSFENLVIELQGDRHSQSNPNTRLPVKEPLSPPRRQESDYEDKVVSEGEDYPVISQEGYGNVDHVKIESQDEILESQGEVHAPVVEPKGTRGVRSRKLAAKLKEALEQSRGRLEGRRRTQKAKGGDQGGEECGLGHLLPEELVGRLVWAKLGRFPWWPAQVFDSSHADEALQKERMTDSDRLVRFFGTYDFAWVDANCSLSDFSVKLEERRKQRKKSFSKAFEEAEQFHKGGDLPPRWNVIDAEPLPQDALLAEGESKPISSRSKRRREAVECQQTDEVNERHTTARCKAEGVSEKGGKERRPEDVGNSNVTGREGGTSSNNPKVRRRSGPNQVQVSGGRKPKLEERGERGLRVMQQLGLAPPYGSPFKPLLNFVPPAALSNKELN